MNKTLVTPLDRSEEGAKCHQGGVNGPTFIPALPVITCPHCNRPWGLAVTGALPRQEYKRLIQHFRAQLIKANASAVHAADNYGQAAIEYGLGIGQGMPSGSLGELFEARSAIEAHLNDLEREFMMGSEKIESLIYGPELF